MKLTTKSAKRKLTLSGQQWALLRTAISDSYRSEFLVNSEAARELRTTFDAQTKETPFDLMFEARNST